MYGFVHLAPPFPPRPSSPRRACVYYMYYVTAGAARGGGKGLVHFFFHFFWCVLRLQIGGGVHFLSFYLFFFAFFVLCIFNLKCHISHEWNGVFFPVDLFLTLVGFGLVQRGGAWGGWIGRE